MIQPNQEYIFHIWKASQGETNDWPVKLVTWIEFVCSWTLWKVMFEKSSNLKKYLKCITSEGGQLLQTSRHRILHETKPKNKIFIKYVFAAKIDVLIFVWRQLKLSGKCNT